MTDKATFVEIKEVNGVSKLTGLHNKKPLKILSPDTHSNVCHLVTTNFGGGMVQGDKIYLKIHNGKNTRTLLTSQANARVFKTDTNNGCYFFSEIKSDENSFFVQLNDPLVLQADSMLDQITEFHLTKGSVMFFLDWVEAGRIHNGEFFKFKKFFSETKIFIDDIPVAIDRFLLEPEKMDCTSPAVFLNHTSFVNIYLIGFENHSQIKLLEEALNTEVEKWSKKNNREIPQLLPVADRVNEYTYLVRISTIELSLLKQFVTTFAQILANKEILGFNPYERKY